MVATPPPLPKERHLRLLPGHRRTLLEDLEAIAGRERLQRVNGRALLAAAVVSLLVWAAAVAGAVWAMQRAGWWSA